MAKKDQQLTPYNEAVRVAYFKVLKRATQLLSSIERDELRFTMQRSDAEPIAFGTKVHELISPLLYLSLESPDGIDLVISFGFEQLNGDDQYAHITSNFIRTLFRLTNTENTGVDIERS